MRIKRLFLCFFLLAGRIMAQDAPPHPFLAPSEYKICWDIGFSPYSGGEDILSAFRLLERGEAWFIQNKPFAQSKSAEARFWRLNELFLAWLPLDYLAVVAQHEVFGHGYRIRDVGKKVAQVAGYEFGTPPPYGEGGGATSYEASSSLTTTQQTAISQAGVDATAILALLTKLKWMQASRIDPRQALLYVLAQQDLNIYIDTLKALDDEDLDGHDIHSYLLCLNQTYPDNILSKGRLRSLSWICLADPFTFYAAFSWFLYLSSGEETSIPMIGSCYLFDLRLGLSPFGPELFFENYLAWDKRPIYFYAKGGRHAKNGYYGIGAYVPFLYRLEKGSFGFRLDLWRQPKLLLFPGALPFLSIDFDQRPSTENPLYPARERHAMRWGGGASLIAAYRGPCGAGGEAELGYKTEGFLPGYSLKASPVVRLALTFSL